MTALKDHLDSDATLMSIFTRRFSRHPERYIEIFGVLRKYELHHIIAKFMMGHRHEEEDGDLGVEKLRPYMMEEDDDHAEGLAKALEELGTCFLKLGQLLSTRPDLLPADYIVALSRLQDSVTPVPSDKITAIIESELGAPVDKLFASFDVTP